MSLTRQSIIIEPTPDPKEVLVVFNDTEIGIRNYLLRDAKALRDSLILSNSNLQLSNPDTDPDYSTKLAQHQANLDAAYKAAEDEINPPAK